MRRLCSCAWVHENGLSPRGDRTRMKIGIMLRHFGQPGGIGMYTANIVNALLEVDQHHQYVLIYNNPIHMGTYRRFQNATEVVAQAPNKLWWDQITIPGIVRKERLDLVF